MKTIERNSNLELLKIFSLFLIIIFHYVFYSGIDIYSLEKPSIYLLDFIYMLGKTGVNCFMLITGYFCIKNNFNIKRLLKIIASCIFYIIFLRIITLCLGFDFGYLFDFPFTTGFWWYMTIYIILYILSPSINRCILNQSRKENLRLCIILITIFSIIPSLVGLSYGFIEGFPFFNRLLWMITVYIIGANIRLYFDDYRNKWLLDLGILVFFTIFLIYYINHFISYSSFIYLDYFQSSNLLLVFLYSIFLFLTFKNLNVKNNKIINNVSSCSLGIYLLHDGSSRIVIWNNIFHNNLVLSNFSTHWYYMLFSIIAIFIVGIIVESFRKILFKFTLDKMLDSKSFNNYIKYIDNTFDSL